MKRIRKKLATLKLMYFEDKGQTAGATGGGAESSQLPAGEGTNTGSDSSDSEEENPNGQLPTEPIFY